MTYHQAQNLLDMRRQGRDMPEDVVNKALELTGDIPVDYVREAMQELVAEGAQ